MDNATKVNNIVMCFPDVALLWWHHRSTDVRRAQFYPEHAKDEARAKLCWLTQQGTVREYVQEFSELVLQILDMGEKETLFFLYGWIEAMGEARVATPRSSRAYQSHVYSRMFCRTRYEERQV
ncbi:reverse transcriptase [Gossypium australe]|uniref:Reverse transcriptase n=1 Tax=Gossypium australe TaxID=47621 RepID=A0A5B6U335_9ROSI|nr:reverse transcriptase [Gossypium australe]